MSRYFALFSIFLFGTSCSSSATGPQGVAGTYLFEVFLEGSTPMNLLDPQPPFDPFNNNLDSIRDTLILHKDQTYRESGTAWRTNMFNGGNADLTIHARGTYTVEGSSIILLPEYGATIGGGSGVVRSGTFMLERYPGQWKFTK